MKLGWTILLAVPAAAQPQLAPRIPEGVKVEHSLVYARTPQKDLLIDLYLPERAQGRLPVILWVHGGAWRGGSKDRCPAVRLVPRGYAAASISYRLSQEAIFPAQIHDVKAAVRWLRANAAHYHLDAERIAAWGSSAGGHLVALLGTSGGVKQLEGDLGNPEFSSRVQAVIDFFGPSDFLQMSKFPGQMDHDAPNSPESQLIGGPIQQHPEKVRRADPITYVSQDDPPFLIMHGDRDETVPLNQSELLHAALTKTGVEVTFEVVRGAGHGFSGPEINAQVDAFLDRCLKRR
jgi:acetyl esterase/lipase